MARPPDLHLLHEIAVRRDRPFCDAIEIGYSLNAFIWSVRSRNIVPSDLIGPAALEQLDLAVERDLAEPVYRSVFAWAKMMDNPLGSNGHIDFESYEDGLKYAADLVGKMLPLFSANDAEGMAKLALDSGIGNSIECLQAPTSK